MASLMERSGARSAATPEGTKAVPADNPPPSWPGDHGADGSITSGAYALDLIHRQVRRLGKLQAEVLADRDPEPLHQLRVSLRRLRTALTQFGAALELPESVTERRIAAVARRTSLCRDLDVLHTRLEADLLPRLPGQEQRALEMAIKRLSRDRSQAFDTLKEALHSPRYLKLLARLNKWQQRPRFTPWASFPWQPGFTTGRHRSPPPCFSTPAGT